MYPSNHQLALSNFAKHIRRKRGIFAAALGVTMISSTLCAQAPSIFPAPEQARADIAAALRSAAATHKRVILEFGGGWCADCHVLDSYFHDVTNRRLLDTNFVLVHINIGYKDANLALAARYEIPIDKGVPALAVLDEHGKLIHSQKDREFISMRNMASSSVTTFLNQWKPLRAGCSIMQNNC